MIPRQNMNNVYVVDFESFSLHRYDTKAKLIICFQTLLECFSLHRYDTKAKPQIATFLEKKLHNYSFFSKLLDINFPPLVSNI